MTPPNAISTTDVEDEIRALRPVANIPIIDDTESEDESSVNQNGEEEIPPVGEPEEAPMVEETDDNTERISNSSIAPLTTPVTSPTAPHEELENPHLNLPVLGNEPHNTFHVGEPSRGTARPRQDDPYMNFVPRQRTFSPERAPHYTTPAMYSLSGDPYRLQAPPAIPAPNPDFTLQMYRQLQVIQDQQRDLRERQTFLEEISVIESERTRLRMDGFEAELIRLRSIVRGLSARLNRLEDANFGRRM